LRFKLAQECRPAHNFGTLAVPAYATLSRAVATAATDLSVQVGALRLRNPIVAASGTFGYGLEFAQHIHLDRLGAFVVKGLSLEPIEGAPAPRLVPTPSGMLNAVGLQNVGVRAFMAEKLPALRNYATPILANVFGYCIDDYIEVLKILEDADGLAGYELNISCPNVKRGGMQFGGDPTQVAEVVGAARKAARKRPLWVKLSPLVADIGLIGRAAAEAGADALTVANTYPAMAVDFRSGKSRLGNQTGGLSGAAIKPITLRLVWEVRKSVEIPIIGLGGIETVEDVLEYLSVGATAVQVGTASFVNPRATEQLVEGLERVANRTKAFTINEIVRNFAAENS
jgi:dihydroorotate dehydrogenase (NAD+) catalytic subunit